MSLKNSWLGVVVLLVVLAGLHMNMANATTLPDPVQDEPIAASPQPGHSSIVLAGGCFWGMQAVFQHVKGVLSATSGYAGGDKNKTSYEQVSTGTTGNAESVQIVYDSPMTLGKLLKIYFSVAHDPTELNYQGPDQGTQYRSTIFYATPEQKAISAAYIAQLNAAKVFSSPIVTTLEPLQGFYAAEAYHQDYARLHPDNAYIRYNDLPKVANLQTDYPSLYKP